MTNAEISCWACGGNDLHIVKKSNISKPIESRNFTITNYDYGITHTIYKCDECGFLQCPELDDVLSYYKELEDTDYEAESEQRYIQARNILKKIIQVKKGIKNGARLLDIGAGSGILVDAAEKMNFHAEGIEPSVWLSKKAAEKGLKVYNGVLPHDNIHHKYDLITIIDVIEHIDDSLNLLTQAKKYLKHNGVIAIVTPNVASLAARLFKWRWWHFRIAHIGYFTPKNLKILCRRAGLEVIDISRPGWVFTLFFLNNRIKTYLPRFLHMPTGLWMKRINVPLNLFDSVMFVVRSKSI